jgi:acyl-CoA synthetase (AMP-forming)/AMP-acid ligase II
LFENFSKFGSQVALMEDGLEPLTYEDLANQSLVFSSHLFQRSLIFCLCSNTIESVVGYVGTIRPQHVGLMLSAKIDEQKLSHLIQNFQPNFLWLPIQYQLPVNHEVVYQYGRYQLVEVFSDRHEMHSDLALLMGTSGSTGSSMMVRQSSKNLFRNARSITESLNLTSSDRALTTLPMNYTYGLSIINSQLEVGGSVVMSEATMMDRQFWNQVKDSGVTYFGGVPYSYEMLDRFGIKRLKGTSIRMLTQAGGKLSSDLVTKLANSCKDLEISFHVMYGQTEATARMSVLSSENVLDHPSSIGRPIPDGRFRILDLDNERELAIGEVGELEYRGPNVMMGYASSTLDLQKPDELEGVLRTGDLAKVDFDGFYYIVGRRKRFIKLLGNRVNLDDVDNFLATHGYETASTGNDDHLTVNAVNPGEHNSLIDLLSSFLSVHKTVIKVRNVETIPRSEAGKVLYSVLGED